jgi:hypothetical protein
MRLIAALSIVLELYYCAESSLYRFKNFGADKFSSKTVGGNSIVHLNSLPSSKFG